MNDFEGTWEHFRSVANRGWTEEQSHAIRHLFFTGGMAMLAAVNDIVTKADAGIDVATGLAELNTFIKDYMADTLAEAKFIEQLMKHPTTTNN